MKTIKILFLSGLIYSTSYSQNVGINSTGAAPSDCAALDIDILNKGLLIPRVALTSPTVFAPVTGTPIVSLLIYNTATAGIAPNNVTPGFYYWAGSTWRRFITGGWATTGNYSTNPSTNFVGTIDAQDLVIRTNNVERIRVTSIGNLGVGTINPSERLQVEGKILVDNSYGSTGGAVVYQNNSDYLFLGPQSGSTANGAAISVFGLTNNDALVPNPGGIDLNVTGAPNSLRILNSGFVGIGIATPNFKLEVNGTTACSGNIWTSDIRMKQNVQTLGFSALDKVMQLRPVSYDWREVLDGGMKGTQIGFIAQELEEVLPSSVVTAENEEQSKGVKYIELIPVLTKAIQEQQALILDLQKENDQLKTQVQSLYERISK